MSIKNREDANRYYQLINELVDDYIDKWKIRPSNLKRYLKPGSNRFNKFIERNKLKDIKGSDIILKDIIDDRCGMETDGVIKFESFKMFESDEFKTKSMIECLYKGIDKATSSMEKILADYFDTNLGDIDIIDPDKHIFKLKNWENIEHDVIIYNKEELDVIKYNMIDYLFLELNKKKINLANNITIDLSNLIKFNMFTEEMEKIFTKNFFVKIIEDCTGSKFKDDVNGHYVWILNHVTP